MTQDAKSSIFSPHQSHTLTNGIREAMLQARAGKALLLIEALYLLHVTPGTFLTRRQVENLLCNNTRMSARTVLDGLSEGQVFQRRTSAYRQNRPGRPAYEYRLPFPAELEAEFAPNQGNTPSDPISLEDLQNLTTYRMALHRELYIRKWLQNGGEGFQMTRGLMAGRLGVSERTVRTYDEKLGHSNTPNYRQRQITWENWNSLPRYKARYDKQGKRQPSKKYLKTVDWQQGRERNLPHVRYLGYVALKDGLAVYEVERLANTYYPYRRPELEAIPDPVDRYFAHMEACAAAGLHQHPDGSWYHQRE